MGKVNWDHLVINTTMIYIKVHLENRNNVRSSLGKEYVNLRLPEQLSESAISKHVKRSKDWVKEILAVKPELINKYKIRDYYKTPQLNILNTIFNVEIEKTERENGKATIKAGVIRVLVPEALDPHIENTMIRTLISRSLGNAFKKYMKDKVMDINNRFFKKEINKIQLKYNVSNWGSCSSRGNINLSTRLLLTPEWVIDYVIVHELSHLVEMNHSPQFWNVVSNVYPKYKKAEKWLKEHNNSCYF